MNLPRSFLASALLGALLAACAGGAEDPGGSAVASESATAASASSDGDITAPGPADSPVASAPGPTLLSPEVPDAEGGADADDAAGSSVPAGDGSDGSQPAGSQQAPDAAGSDQVANRDTGNTQPVGVARLAFDTSALEIDRFTRDNAPAALSAFIRVLRHEDLVRVMRDGYQLIRRIEAGDPGFALVPVSTGRADRVLDCVGGGSVDALHLSTVRPQDGATYTFRDCVMASEIFNGVLVYTANAGQTDRSTYTERMIDALAPTPFSIERAGGVRESIKGRLIERRTSSVTNATGINIVILGELFVAVDGTRSVGTGAASVSTASRTEYVLANGPEAYYSTVERNASGLRSHYFYGPGVQTAGNRYFEVDPTSALLAQFLSDSADADYGVGQLPIRLRLPGGLRSNSLVMNARSADPSMFTLTIVELDGSASSLSLLWSDDYRLGPVGSPFD